MVPESGCVVRFIELRLLLRFEILVGLERQNVGG